MRHSEEIDLREGLVYDPAVKGYDSSFWHGDTANLLADTVRNAVKLGDTALVGSASSYSQYLMGDYEFTMAIDSLSPDSNDSEKYFGLRNVGDTLQRGAAYFNLSYDTDTTAAGDCDSSPTTRPFTAVIFDEAGNKQKTEITWDTNWGGGARLTRFRIIWESDGYRFLINDTVYATLGCRDTNNNLTAVQQINTTIPQAVRLSNRSLDTTDTSSTALKLLTIRNARKVI